MDEQVRVGSRRPVRGWALAAVAAVIVLVVYAIRYEMLPFVVAGAIGFVTDPAIAWLQARLGGRRWAGAVPLFLLLLVVVAAFAYWIGTIVAADLSSLAQQGPAMLHQLIGQVVGPDGVTAFGQNYTADSLTQDIQKRAAGLIGPAGYAEGLGIGVAALLGVFLTLVLTAYFMLSGRQVFAGMVWLVPPERRGAVRRLLPRIVPALRRYLVGIVVVVVATAAAAYVGFGLLFGLPHAALLSVAVGLLEIIPALGPFASMVLVGVSALQQHSLGAAAGLMGYAVFLRLGIDNVLGPLVLGRSARLHPVAIIFAFVVGASLFGVLGLLLAVPAAACTVIVLEQYYGEAPGS